MVLSNGTKSARRQQSIVNRTNTCGGNKKAGMAPTIGHFLSSNPNLIRAITTGPKNVDCRLIPGYISTTVQTQHRGYRATLGGMN